jgi:hypothetical protein
MSQQDVLTASIMTIFGYVGCTGAMTSLQYFQKFHHAPKGILEAIKENGWLPIFIRYPVLGKSGPLSEC